jgi:hypothetical protein
MARREDTQSLKCPQCGTTGVATYEENETPPHHQGRLDRKLIDIEGEFRAGLGYDPEIYCARCEIKVS